MAGPKVDQPNLHAKIGAQGSDLNDIAFLRRQLWQRSQLSRSRRHPPNGVASSPQPTAAPEKHNIVQIRALRAIFGAKIRSAEVPSGHGRPIIDITQRAPPQTPNRPTDLDQILVGQRCLRWKTVSSNVAHRPLPSFERAYGRSDDPRSRLVGVLLLAGPPPGHSSCIAVRAPGSRSSSGSSRPARATPRRPARGRTARPPTRRCSGPRPTAQPRSRVLRVSCVEDRPWVWACGQRAARIRGRLWSDPPLQVFR